MKSLLKDKIVDLDLKLPSLGLLLDKAHKVKSFTERKSKETDKVIASENNIASTTKRRYEAPNSSSKKDRSFVKYVKKTEDSPKKTKKVIRIGVISERNQSRSEQAKNQFRFQQRQDKERLVMFKAAIADKKRQKFNLGDLLQYNQTKYSALPNIKIPKLRIAAKKDKKQGKVKEKQTIPCQYESVELLSQLDFLRLFIVEQLIYILSQSNNYKKEEMVSFCRIYLQNSEKDSFYIISNVFKKREIVEEALVLEKMAVYVVLLICTEEVLSKENQNLVKSICTFIHKNNLILLDLLMMIGDFENIEITSQFHIFNTMRFNESRRKVNYSNDGIELIRQNNATLKSLLNIVAETSKFQSLSGFVKEIMDGDLVFSEQLDEVYFVLFSFQHVLVQAEEEEYPQPESPFLPPTSRPYTLVLDLDETLIHTKEIDGSPHFLIRPYCHEFLKILAQFYEIVIFTASVKQYADAILDTIDKDKNITHRLYRQHTRFQDYVSIKDLSMLGRDLSKTIIIDNIPSNFKLQPKNGIYIATWTGSTDDCCLLNLIPVLQLIVRKQSQDVRKSLQVISKHMEEMLRDSKEIDLDNLSIE